MGKRVPHLCERLEKPLLVLAVLGLVLHFAELSQWFPDGWHYELLTFYLCLDLVFFVDLLLKTLTLGTSYRHGPWFIVDLCSALPLFSSLLEFFGVTLMALDTTRVSRLLRLLRLVRLGRLVRLAHGAREARLVRLARGLGFFPEVSQDFTQTPLFCRTVRAGVPLFLIGVLAAGYFAQNWEMAQFEKDIVQRLNFIHSLADLRLMPEWLPTASDGQGRHGWLLVNRPIPGGPSQVYFSLERVERRVDFLHRLLMILSLVFLTGGMFFLWHMANEEKKEQDFNLLSRCFSPGLLEKLQTDPTTFDLFHREWVSVAFIDIQGFTSHSETLGDDIETLALKIRNTMNIACENILVHHGGIIDKFLGDAVLCWFGSHFSKVWEPLENWRRRLLISDLEILTKDIISLERELSRDLPASATNGTPGAGGGNSDLETEDDEEDAARPQRVSRTELFNALADLRERKGQVMAARKKILAEHPDDEQAFAVAVREYRQAVARSGVLCVLETLAQAEKMPGTEYFPRLKAGLTSGLVGLGNFGAGKQIAYTVLGATVNLASRLEGLSSSLGCRFLVDATTVELLENMPDLVFRRLGKVPVKGLATEVQVFEPMKRTPEAMTLVDLFHRGLEAQESGNLKAAIACFQQADQLWPGGDPPSRKRLQTLTPVSTTAV